MPEETKKADATEEKEVVVKKKKAASKSSTKKAAPKKVEVETPELPKPVVKKVVIPRATNRRRN